MFSANFSTVIDASAVNLSEGGMLLSSPVFLRKGDLVQVYFLLADGMPLITDAEVVRSELSESEAEVDVVTRVALAFSGLAPAEICSLRRHIAALDAGLSNGPIAIDIDGVAAQLNGERCRRSGKMMIVESVLPFLRIGSVAELVYEGNARGRGTIRSVQVYIPPDHEIPRIRVSIDHPRSLDSAGAPS